MLHLVEPSGAHVGAYVVALKRGYSPSSSRPSARFEELRRIEADTREFLGSLVDPEGRGGVPSLTRWIWDGDFSGSIGLRWQHGTVDLPPTCLGHIGYSVVEWKRRRGYATEALRLILPEAREIGLPYVEIVTDAGNAASQGVALANGAYFVEQFRKSVARGGGEALRFRIDL